MQDHQERTNARAIGERLEGYAGVPAAFLKTMAGPPARDGVSGPNPVAPTPAVPYPSEPASTYYARFMAKANYPRTPGAQEVEFTPTNFYTVFQNLRPTRYLEEGTVVLAFQQCGKWFCL